MKNFILNLTAIFLLILGIIGIFIPILPTTPFLLGAALITVKSSPAIYNKIIKNVYLSHFIRNYYEHCGVPKSTIRKALLFLWGSLGIAIYFAELNWVKILLLIIGLGVSCHLCMLKKSQKEELKFTLIELLVSMGIITILASLLLSTIHKAKNLAEKSFCLNNLHQIGMAIQLYSADNNDLIPALSEGFSGSTMVVKMMNVPLGLGRIIGDYGTIIENYGCPLNSKNTPENVKQSWLNRPASQIAYFYRHTDNNFNERLSSATNNLKAMVMDFCCISTTPIVAHNFEDVNILYSDGSVMKRKNSAVPNEFYTVETAFANGQMQTDCRQVWQNADNP
ncbi:MAG: DUF454 family protein [Lentisphaeria bacterium]|nr:DUF454 family protein [Lentisphaeria bacterium]